MGSVFLCLLTSSSFCPSSVYRESLGHSLFPERPFYPFHPGLPRCPGFGATGGRQFPPLPIREAERWISLSITPSRVAPIGPGEVQERHPPHPGGHDAAVPRRLSSALPILPLAPPGFCPGDWDTVTAGPGGPVSHEAGRLTDLDRDMLDLPACINTSSLFLHVI